MSRIGVLIFVTFGLLAAAQQPQQNNIRPEQICFIRCIANCVAFVPKGSIQNQSRDVCNQKCQRYNTTDLCSTDECWSRCHDMDKQQTLPAPTNLRSKKDDGVNKLIWNTVPGAVLYMVSYKDSNQTIYDPDSFVIAESNQVTDFMPPRVSPCDAFDIRVSAASEDGVGLPSLELNSPAPVPMVNPKLRVIDTVYVNEPFVSDFYEANGTVEVTFEYSKIDWPLGEQDLELTPLFHLVTCSDPDLSQGIPVPEFRKGPRPRTLVTALGSDMMYRKCRFVYYLQSVSSKQCGSSNEMHSPPPDALQTMTIQCDTVRNAPCRSAPQYEHPVCGQIDTMQWQVLNQRFDFDDKTANLTVNVTFVPLMRANEPPTLYYIGLYGNAMPYGTKEEFQEAFLGVNITNLIGSVNSCNVFAPDGGCVQTNWNNSLVITNIHPKALYGLTICGVKDPRNLTLPDVTAEARSVKPMATKLQIIKPEHHSNPAGLIIGICIAALAFVAFVVLAACWWVRRSRRVQKLKHKLQMAQIERDNLNRYTDFPKKQDIWEIERRNLVIHDDKKLGSGAFGAVYLGRLIGRSLVHKDANSPLGVNLMRAENCQVAVKMLPEYADEMSKSEFLREIALMKTLGYHERLVNMLACVTETEPLCLVVECCSDGDLLHFLRERCKYMIKLDDLGINYHEAPVDDSFDLDMIVTLKLLLQFAVQISYGLEYLSQKGFVHRDVAARNVLVNDRNACKIGDFGLCRYIYADQGQYKSKGGRLPLKWMSPEAIRHYEFSINSDVWSFGILLFEVITLGGSPYPGVPPEDMLPFLEGGGRIEQPDNCPDNFYEVMKECWNGDAEKRPEFSEIRMKLASQLEEITDDYSYLKLDSAKDYYNVQYGDQRPEVIIIPEEADKKILDRRISKDSLPVDGSIDGSTPMSSARKDSELDSISIDMNSLKDNNKTNS